MADALSQQNRQHLFDYCADVIRSEYQGQEIYWPEVDRVNELIGKATTKEELHPLLREYRNAILGPPIVPDGDFGNWRDPDTSIPR